MRLKPAASAPNSSLAPGSTRAPRSPASTRASPACNRDSGLKMNSQAEYSKAIALPMVNATITNCTAFRMAVSRDRWYSIADTKVSMRATKASACCAESSAPGPGETVHLALSSNQSRWTAAKACCDSPSCGTSSGRAGSPVCSTLTLWSNCAASPAIWCASARASVWAMRQVCMRMRPASLTAAAPPSNCQVTQSVSPIEANAISNKAPPMAPSLAERLHDRGMRALY